MYIYVYVTKDLSWNRHTDGRERTKRKKKERT